MWDDLVKDLELDIEKQVPGWRQQVALIQHLQRLDLKVKHFQKEQEESETENSHDEVGSVTASRVSVDD